METMYKGYWITFNFYGKGEYTVQYCGDDVVFDTEEEAKEFLENLNPIRAEANELLSKYVNCQVGVTDLLQFIDRLVRDEKFWEE